MSVDAKLFVVVDKDKVLDVIDAVVDGLNSWVRKELDSYWKEHTSATSRFNFLFDGKYKDEDVKFTNTVKIAAYDMEMLTLRFGCGDTSFRMLSVFPRDFNDYSDIIDGNKLVFSIGNWGKYNEIMRIVAIACETFGDVYYDHNDCDDEGFVKILDFSENSIQF